MPDVVTLNIPSVVALPSAGLLLGLLALVWRVSTAWARTEKEVAEHAVKLSAIETCGSVPVQVYLAEDREWKRNMDEWKIDMKRRMERHSESIDAMWESMRVLARGGE